MCRVPYDPKVKAQIARSKGLSYEQKLALITGSATAAVMLIIGVPTYRLLNRRRSSHLAK